MPVVLKDHDPDLDLEPGTTKSDIVALLYTNTELGYSPKEVHEELAIPHSTAKVTLKRLYDAGDVGKTADGYYYALDSREDIHRYVAALDQLERLFETAAESPDSTPTPRDPPTDEAVDAELAALEAEIDDQ